MTQSAWRKLKKTGDVFVNEVDGKFALKAKDRSIQAGQIVSELRKMAEEWGALGQDVPAVWVEDQGMLVVDLREANAE